MSVQATTWVWEHSQSEGSTRLVLLAIADAANRDGKRSFQSAETIARMCKMSSRTVRRQIKVLQELGELEVEGRSGFHGTNSYRIVGVSSGLSLGHNHDLGQSVTGDTGGQAIGHLGHTDRTSGVASSDTAMSTNPNTPFTPSIPDAPASRRKPSRPIPDDWHPLERHHQKAREKHLDVNLQAEAFTNHALANDRRCVNWDRAFDNWILKATPGRSDYNPLDRSSYG